MNASEQRQHDEQGVKFRFHEKCGFSFPHSDYDLNYGSFYASSIGNSSRKSPLFHRSTAHELSKCLCEHHREASRRPESATLAILTSSSQITPALRTAIPDTIEEFNASGVGTVFASGLDEPSGLALTVPEPSTLALLSLGTLSLLAYDSRRRMAKA
jgi:hypothetical protein